MAFRKSVCVLLFIVVSMIALTCGHPGKEKQKIRIHIPVKHHTHVHTKTIIKKVPVPVPVPIKEHHIPKPKHIPEPKYEVEEDDEDDLEGYHYSKSIYSKKKRRVHHPFI